MSSWHQSVMLAAPQVQDKVNFFADFVDRVGEHAVRTGLSLAGLFIAVGTIYFARRQEDKGKKKEDISTGRRVITLTILAVSIFGGWQFGWLVYNWSNGLDDPMYGPYNYANGFGDVFTGWPFVVLVIAAAAFYFVNRLVKGFVVGVVGGLMAFCGVFNLVNLVTNFVNS